MVSVTGLLPGSGLLAAAPASVVVGLRNRTGLLGGCLPVSSRGQSCRVRGRALEAKVLGLVSLGPSPGCPRTGRLRRDAVEADAEQLAGAVGDRVQLAGPVGHERRDLRWELADRAGFVLAVAALADGPRGARAVVGGHVGAVGEPGVPLPA